MTYYIKLHYLSSYDYDGLDEVSDSYNETLELLWKEKEVFYDEIKNEFTKKYYKWWVDYDGNDRYYDIFDFVWDRSIETTSYKIVKINFLDILEAEFWKMKKIQISKNWWFLRLYFYLIWLRRIIF